MELDHVLVVRPPDPIREVLLDDLQEEARTVSTADDCLAALRMLTAGAPAVVLVDMLLRDPHPRALVALSLELGRAPVFLGLAPCGHDEALAEAIDLGMFCCLRLPITEEDLLDAVSLACRRGRGGSGPRTKW